MATATAETNDREQLLQQLANLLGAVAPGAEPKSSKRLLTIDEVCEELGVKKSYVYSVMNEGKLAYVPLSDGRREFRRVRAEDLDAFIQSRLIPAG